jgi:hypothetical protein
MLPHFGSIARSRGGCRRLERSRAPAWSADAPKLALGAANARITFPLLFF